MRKLSKSLLSSLGLSILVAACGTAGTAGEPDPSSVNPPASDPATTTESLRNHPYADKSSIDVAKSASLGIGLRGGAVAQLGGQTVQRALIDLQAVELVSSTGATLSLLANPVTLDLLALQNDLAQIVQSQSLEPGTFSQIRCRIGSVFIGTLDGNGNPVNYLSGDATPFDGVSADGNLPLSLGQVDADGGFNVGLPESGLAVSGATSFALRFDLADSLFTQDNGLVFNPVVWAADASQLSSVEVALQVSSDVAMSSFDGFQLELLNAAQLPVAFVPVTAAGQVLSATFQYLDVVEGPFTAVLVPPVGVALSSQIAVAINVSASVHAETTVSFQSVSRAEQGGTLVLGIHSANKGKCVQHAFNGDVVDTSTPPVGSFDQVAQPWQQVAPVAAHHPQWSHPENMPTSQQPFDNRTGHGGVERPGHDTGPEIQKPGAGGKHPSQGNQGNATPGHGDKPPIQLSPPSTDKDPEPQKDPDSPSTHPSHSAPGEDPPVGQSPKPSKAPVTGKNPGQGNGKPSLSNSDQDPAQGKQPKPSLTGENPGQGNGKPSLSNSDQDPAQGKQPKPSSGPLTGENPVPGKGKLPSSNGDQDPPQETPMKPSGGPATNKSPQQGNGKPSLSNGDQDPPQGKQPKPSSAPLTGENPGQGKGKSPPSKNNQDPPQQTPPKPSSAPAMDKNPAQGQGSSSPNNSMPAPAHETPPSQPGKQSSASLPNHADQGSAAAPSKDVHSGNGGGPSGGNQGGSNGDGGHGGSKPGNKHP